MPMTYRFGLLALVLACAGCGDSAAAAQRYLENGNQYLADGRYEEAVVEYRNALQQDERLGEARAKLSEAYEKLGNLAGALREAVRAADLLPESDEAQIRAASYLLLSGAFEDARTRIQPVLDRSPSNAEAQIVFGNALAGLRDLDGAVTEIEEAIQLDPARGLTYSNLGALRQAQGEAALAREAFERAVEIEPMSIPAWLALANYLWSSAGDIPAAENALQRALGMDPDNILANRALAALYMASGRREEAEAPLKVIAAATTDPRVQLSLADYYLVLGRTDAAREVLQPLAAERATASDAQTRLAAIAYAAGDRIEGHRLLDDVLGREPDRVPALVLKGRWHVLEGELPEAEARAAAAVRADAQSVPAHYLLGVAQMAQRKNDEAIASFNEVLRLNPRAVPAQIALSNLHLAGGAADTAVQMAEWAVESAPEDARARVALVRGLIARREAARADTEVSALLERYPEVALVHALRGDVRLLHNDVPGARAAFERAQQIAPQSFEALVGLVRVDLAGSNAAAARARVEPVVAANPRNTGLLMLAAQVYAASRDVAAAERTLRTIIDIDPSHMQAYTALATVYIAQGKLSEARVELDQVAAREPRNIGVRTIAALVTHAQQDVPEARRRYEEILRTEPGAAVAANNLAWIYADERTNLDTALRLAQQATTALPNVAAAHDTLGWVHYQRELPLLAITAFERSIELAPQEPSYHYRLALAHNKAGQRAEAVTAVQRALKLNPEYADAKTLLASLQ